MWRRATEDTEHGRTNDYAVPGPGCQSCCGRQGEADDTHVTPPIQCAPTAMMPARRCDHVDAGGEPGRIRRHPYDAAHVVRADRDDAAREPG